MIGMAGQITRTILGVEAHTVVFDVIEFLNQGFFFLVEELLEKFELFLVHARARIRGHFGISFGVFGLNRCRTFGRRF